MEPLLRLEHVSKQFSLRSKRFFAVEDVSLTIAKGETLGIVGESGCGKSTLARLIMGVFPPTSGRVLFHGEELRLSSAKRRAAFAQHAQMIFQDPYASLDPRLTAEAIIAEGLEIRGGLSPQERRQRVHTLLGLVGLSAEHAARFPHEFSGGQRQRIGIARALAVEPEFLVCDEPISALDISVQSQIVNLLGKLRAELGLTYLFIAHDLNMVRYLSNRIAVMYLGNLVELAGADTLCTEPRHPYTRALLNAVLTLQPAQSLLDPAQGAVPDSTVLHRPEAGCAFALRCPHAQERCRRERPVFVEKETGHFIACHMQ